MNRYSSDVHPSDSISNDLLHPAKNLWVTETVENTEHVGWCGVLASGFTERLLHCMHKDRNNKVTFVQDEFSMNMHNSYKCYKKWNAQ